MRAPWTDRWAGAITVAAAILAFVGVLGSGLVSYVALTAAAGLTMLLVRGEDAADRTAPAHAGQDSPADAVLSEAESLVGRR